MISPNTDLHVVRRFVLSFCMLTRYARNDAVHRVNEIQSRTF